MCAVVGAEEGYDPKLIAELFKWSRVRGLHAFGYCYSGADALQVEKFLSYKTFLEHFLQTKPKSFIAHFRYSTSGDWQEYDNNQPIMVEDCGMVFNGVVDMGTKREMEKKYGVVLETGNDGEVALRHFLDGNLEELLSGGRTFSGLFLRYGQSIVPYSNGLRPLYLSVLNGVKYYASTKDILRRSSFLEVARVGS